MVVYAGANVDSIADSNESSISYEIVDGGGAQRASWGYRPGSASLDDLTGGGTLLLSACITDIDLEQPYSCGVDLHYLGTGGECTGSSVLLASTSNTLAGCISGWFETDVACEDAYHFSTTCP